MPFVHIENARVKEQEDVMGQIEKDGVCPFCPENLKKYHTEPILAEGDYWTITTNRWPYVGAKIHFLAIAKKHIKTLGEIDGAAAAELFKLFNEQAARVEMTGGTLAMRFGNEKGYASSVEHLHVHLIEPDLNNPEHPGIKFPISKPSTGPK